MPDREKVIRGLEICANGVSSCQKCPFKDKCKGTSNAAMAAAIELLKAQEPRVMTLEEVIEHYSLPPVFPDDLGMQFDYYEDIEPLYFDFPHQEDPWIVHWRGYNQVGKYLEDWKADYGKSWRCWTSRPTDEQRKRVKWDG